MSSSRSRNNENEYDEPEHDDSNNDDEYGDMIKPPLTQAKSSSNSNVKTKTKRKNAKTLKIEPPLATPPHSPSLSLSLPPAVHDINTSSSSLTRLTSLTSTPNNSNSALRSTRPSGMSPQHQHQRSQSQLSRPSSTSNSNIFPPITPSNDQDQAPPPIKLLAQLSKPKNQSNSNSSVTVNKTLLSLLQTFTHPQTFAISTTINLNSHSLSQHPSIPITNIVVQEVCNLQPLITDLNLTNCVDVTDVGLWAISLHLTHLQKLNLSNCDKFTAIGYRSLSIKLFNLLHLDLTRCTSNIANNNIAKSKCNTNTNIDDGIVRIVTCGVWRLQTLLLNNCEDISDVSIEYISTRLTSLRRLEVNGCSNVGSYSNSSLINIGRHLKELVTLEIDGIRHVSDVGISAVANPKGCVKLTALKLAGLQSVSHKGVACLAKHLKLLSRVSLINLHSISDTSIAILSQGCPLLTHVDLTDCRHLSPPSLLSLCQNCPKLSTLNLTSTPHTVTNDSSLALLAHHCKTLEHLNLTSCLAVTQKGLSALSSKTGCTQIGYLNVSSCPNITTGMLNALISRLRFCVSATEYTGYSPRPNAHELRLLYNLSVVKQRNCIIVQALIRGVLARGGVEQARYKRRVEHCIPLLQSRIRGYLVKIKYNERMRCIKEVHCVALIIATWYGYSTRKRVTMVRRNFLYTLHNEQCANMMQRVYRGYAGRVECVSVRNAVAVEGVKEARIRARLEWCSLIIQRCYRGWVGRGVAGKLRLMEDMRRGKEIEAIAAVYMIQRIFRGYKGRRKAEIEREERELNDKKWRNSVTIQRVHRGVTARVHLAKLRVVQAEHLMHSSATLIQTKWRAYRGVYIGKVTASLYALRRLEFTSIVKIQATWLAKVGRGIAVTKRDESNLRLLQLKSTLLIQRLARGHRGRETACCQAALKKMKGKVLPLYTQLSSYETKLTAVESKIAYISGILKPLKLDTVVLIKELKLIQKSKSKYWDSSRISGAPARYLTVWLVLRLNEQLAVMKVRNEELDEQLDEFMIKEREMLRCVRKVRREIAPLTSGTTTATKILRTKTLRLNIRAQRTASTVIQKHFRRYHVYSAVHSPVLGFWVEDYDITTGRNLYFNKVGGETRWVKPLEMTLNEMFHIGMQLQSLSQNGNGSSNRNGGYGGVNNGESHGGWTEISDVKKKCVYYFNGSSNQYRFNRPNEFGDGRADTNDGWFERLLGYDSDDDDDDDDDEGGGRGKSKGKDHLLLNSTPITTQTIGNGQVWKVMYYSPGDEDGNHIDNVKHKSLEEREDNSSSYYYANVLDGSLRWSLSPRSAFAKREDFRNQGGTSISTSADEDEVVPAQEEEDVTIGKWRRVYSESEGAYYVDESNGETRWDVPDVFRDAGYS